MITGIITLYSPDDEVLDIRKYEGRKGDTKSRKEIIEHWRLIYGPRLKQCYYHIEPSFDEKLIKEDGSNRRKFDVQVKRRKPLVKV